MRIHSDILTERDIYEAMGRAGDSVRGTVTIHGSRSRAHAFNVNLTGTSSRRTNPGTSDAYWGVDRDRAATWDEWGMFLSELFRRDPNLTIPSAYPTAGDFDRMTGGRYDTLTPEHQHRNHKWNYAGEPGTLKCACGAIRAS